MTTTREIDRNLLVRVLAVVLIGTIAGQMVLIGFHRVVPDSLDRISTLIAGGFLTALQLRPSHEEAEA